MRKRRPTSSTTPSSRTGLAPLELVLSLPILLFVMGLMIVFGTAAAWKVRTISASRQAVWRAFTPRTGANDPHPRGWPASAQMQVRDAVPAVLDGDPYSDFNVVRGPMLMDEGSGTSLPVNTDLLDFQDGLKDGFARIERKFALLEQMPPHGFIFPRHHHVLDGSRWQYRTMGIPTNVTRRVPFLYPMQLQSVVPELTEQFTTRALAIHFNPHKPDLTPLEGGDPEIRALIGRESPDFQPKVFLGSERATIAALAGRILLPQNCNGNPEQVRSQDVERLRNQIRGVPNRMADYYIGVYQSVIAQLQSANPPAPGAAGLIAELEAKIEQLNQFKSQL